MNVSLAAIRADSLLGRCGNQQHGEADTPGSAKLDRARTAQPPGPGPSPSVQGLQTSIVLMCLKGCKDKKNRIRDRDCTCPEGQRDSSLALRGQSADPD